MADILTAYDALSPNSTRQDVQTVLQSIIDALPFAFDTSTRVTLLSTLLNDLSTATTNASKSRLSPKDASLSLLAVKTLGKDPSGSESISSPAKLSALLTLVTAFKDDPDASNEALRCLANVLFLVPSARDTLLQKGVDGGETCVALLEKTTRPDDIFVLGRILFLCTASGPEWVLPLVEDTHNGKTIVDIIATKLDVLTVAILAGTKMSREAMSEVLKVTFNLLLHYPKMTESEPQTTEAPSEEGYKVIGDFWSSRLDGFLPPLLRIFNSLPPTFPSPIAAPLSHAIHSLITIPINPSLRPVWFPAPPTAATLPHSSASSSPKSRTPQRSSTSSSRNPSPNRGGGSGALPSPTTGKPTTTLDRALSALAAAGRKSLSRTPSPTTTSAAISALHNSNASFDILQRAFDLLDVSFLHYFPGAIDPDDPEVRERCKSEQSDNSLDDVLSPLLVLISRLCLADELSRKRLRAWLVPVDLDRSSPLEERADLLGRCLRLLGCVYHPRLKDSVGEMLFAMSDSNASTLSALVGYGNVAGFLFHKGVLNAPPQDAASSDASLVTPSGAAINPITGTTEAPKPTAPDMSDDEKEREMEKLFVLFDRLERTGALPAEQNPMRKAIQQGMARGNN